MNMGLFVDELGEQAGDSRMSEELNAAFYAAASAVSRFKQQCAQQVTHLPPRVANWRKTTESAELFLSCSGGHGLCRAARGLCIGAWRRRGRRCPTARCGAAGLKIRAATLLTDCSQEKRQCANGYRRMVENIVAETKVRATLLRLLCFLGWLSDYPRVALTLATFQTGASSGWIGLCDRPADLFEETADASTAGGVP